YGQQLPIKYIYFILIGLGLGLVFGAKTYIQFIYWNETSEFRWQRYALPHVINFTFWGLLTPLVFYFVHRFPVHLQDQKRMWPSAIMASLMVAFIHETASNAAWFIPLHLTGVHTFTENDMHMVLGALPSAYISRIFEYWILFMGFAAYDFYQRYQSKALQLAQTETQLVSAKLSALKLQLQPHFLFNTLNTISSLTEFDVKGAQKMLTRLGDLMRSLLDQNKQQMISLREELQFTKNYLSIEQVRFQDRLSLEFDIEKDVLRAQVPSLILQPLVENAIKHGFANHTDDGIISVSAHKLEGNILALKVQDDGRGTNREMQALLATGIGLKNVKERLMQLYPNEHLFKIVSQQDQGFEAIIHIPFKIGIEHV
ncbi:MAG: histidine kinase, partial [Bacteroidota bacterium]